MYIYCYKYIYIYCNKCILLYIYTLLYKAKFYGGGNLDSSSYSHAVQRGWAFRLFFIFPMECRVLLGWELRFFFIFLIECKLSKNCNAWARRVNIRYVCVYN